MCRSVPHTPARSTRMSTSSRPTSGTGRSATVKPRSGWALTRAFTPRLYLFPTIQNALQAAPPPPPPRRHIHGSFMFGRAKHPEKPAGGGPGRTLTEGRATGVPAVELWCDQAHQLAGSGPGGARRPGGRGPVGGAVRIADLL